MRYDVPFNIPLMEKASSLRTVRRKEVFGIKIVVMGSNPPVVSLSGYEADGSLENTKVTYRIQYDGVYPSDVGEMVEYSENYANFEIIKQCCFINRDGCRYRVLPSRCSQS